MTKAPTRRVETPQDVAQTKSCFLVFTMVIPGNKEDARTVDGFNTNWQQVPDGAVASIRHSGGANYGFVDGHIKWYPGYNPNEMTFRYDSMHGWQ